MLAVSPAELGTDPLLVSLPAMARFTSRKRHHAPIATLLGQADELREMGRSIANCANALEVLLELPEGADPYALLTGYNPCNRRVCPMCEWRRSMVWRGRLMPGLDAFFHAHPTHRAIFATFTVRSVPLGELAEAIREMHRSWDRMIRCKFFPTSFWFRRTEVTLKHANTMPLSLATNKVGEISGRRQETERAQGVEQPQTLPVVSGFGPVMAHPHIHALLLVPASYFSHGYVRKTEWTQQWQMAARLDYTPVVDVRKARAQFTTGEAFFDARAAGIEAMKYTTKSTDLVKISADLPEFVHQMRGHRLVAMSSKLRAFVPDHDPTADEMGDDQAAGLPRLHPGISCVAQWDRELSDYVLTPRA